MDRRLSDRMLRFLREFGEAVDEASEYETAVSSSLRSLCLAIDAGYGEAWLPDVTDSNLVLGAAHYGGEECWAAFEVGRRRLSYPIDVGVIGLAWRTRRALWAEDVGSLVSAHPEEPACPDEGRRLSLFVQPICADDQVLAVAAFYVERLRSDGLAERLAAVAARLGKALQKKRLIQELEYANVIIEQSPTVVYRALATDGAPRVYTSRNVTRFGYTVEDCKHGRFNFPDFVHEDDRPRVLEEVGRMLEGGLDVFEQEYRLITKDGDIRFIHDRTVAIRDAAGTITHWQGALTDITERWLAREQLAQSNRKLEGLSVQLSKYLSPQIYASIFSGRQTAEITSKRKKLTVFFSDIADFTHTTDSMESEELTDLLNRYLTEMSDIALAHSATIDKFIGDAILIFFGDPESHGAREDALRCVKMAIAMQQRMRELEGEWRRAGIEKPFRLRIGINTGFCTVGNFGSSDRMDYTIIGNEVNLAARLQSSAELGGILIGHETYSLVKDAIPAEELPPIMVKGFAIPVANYRVLDIEGDADEEARIMRHQRPGAHIDIDLRRLSSADRDEMIELVEELGKRLRSRS